MANDVPDLNAAHKAAPERGAVEIERTDYVFARYAIQDDHYVGFYETWAKAILYLLNKHYMRWDPRRRAFAPDTEVPPWRQQPVNPFVYAVFRSALAKLLKQRPALECVPPSGDSDDRASARLGEALLTFLHRHIKMPAKLKRTASWFLATGNVYGRVFWNPAKGKMIQLTIPMTIVGPDGVPKEVECPCGPDGQPIMKEDGTADLEAAPHEMPEGEIDYATESPLCVRLNPEAESVEDSYEMFVAKLIPRERAAAEYGIDAAELPTATSTDTQMEFEDLLASAAAGGPDLLGLAGNADRSEAIGDRVLVIEYYRDKDAEYPEGRHWIQVGKVQVWPNPDGSDPDFPDGESPLPDGLWPPLVPMQDTPNPSSPLAIGLLQNVVPLNEKYNHLDAKILEHEVTMAMGGIWWVAPEDQGIQITSDPAQVRVSKGMMNGRPPVQAKLEALPDEVYADRDRIVTTIQLVSGLGEVGLGSKPEGVTSGRGFLVLQEVVDSVFTPSLESYESFYEEIGRRMLLLAKKHYREERTIQIRGSRGQWEFRSFKGSDLADGLDVRVQAGSSFPWSKSAKHDLAIELVTAMPGLVTDPMTGEVDPQRLAKFLDQGGIGAFQAEDNPDLLEIEREHGQFEAWMAPDPETGEAAHGALPMIGFWQNHAAHAQAHFDFLKKDAQRMSRWPEENQQAFLAHCLETLKTLEATVASTMPGADPANDQPPPGGDAPGGGTAAGGSAPAGGGRGRSVVGHGAKASNNRQKAQAITPAERRQATGK